MKKISGIYELYKIESFVNGSKTDEVANHGLLTITESGKMSVVCGSNLSVMAYSGKYRIEDSKLWIEIKTCNYRDQENKTLIRPIILLTQSELVLDVSGSDESRKIITHWRRV